MGKGRCVLRFSTYFTDLRIIFLFNLCWIWAQTNPFSLQRFPGALIPHSMWNEAGSRRGSSLCSWRFAWLLPFTVSSASKKNWCYLLKWKLQVLFVTEDFLCAFPQPVQWRQEAAAHGPRVFRELWQQPLHRSWRNPQPPVPLISDKGQPVW